MTSSTNTSAHDIPVPVQAEAAAWIARLHGSDRTHEDDQSFKRWLAANDAHAVAFERMTELWESATRLKSDVLSRHRKPATHLRKPHPAARIAALAAVLSGITLAVFFFQDPGISTAVGERRNLTLEDGTHLTLNTATRVRIHYSDSERRVALEEGEALFEVARRSARPFIVEVAGQEVTALGTAFVVRREEDDVAVTLLEGKVTVSAPSAVSPVTLNVGQRLTLAPRRKPQVDRPALERVTAWRQGLIALDKTPLQSAVVEMNRYSTVKLRIVGEGTQDIQVSGLFRAGDSEDFARALARTHGLQTREDADTIILFFP